MGKIYNLFGYDTLNIQTSFHRITDFNTFAFRIFIVDYRNSPGFRILLMVSYLLYFNNCILNNFIPIDVLNIKSNRFQIDEL